MQVVVRKIKGKRVPPRQPNNTKPPWSERLDDRSASTAGAAPNTTPSFHSNPFFAETPHSRGSPIQIPLTTKMEAIISTKMIGKDELKGWMIARTTKPLPEQRYRKLGFEFRNGKRHATALLEGDRHDAD
ncbi:hypothetical protein DEO72_LG7g909 [Vigna unguiculata]|uniref:Uncharacterized protein n=1 Tax=Vigna unguiculata TaxID=3917 RepID=A0A4D6ME41_VIGUN|nr:hypothetical protein DEO72_LG7g909 [Vigna unguiculata]